MRCIRPGGAAAEESHMEKTTQCIAGGGLLAAIAAVLQLVGSAIRFGPFSVSLVLIPIVLGAALYGWGMGCWLGLVFGAVVLLSGGCRPLSGGGSGRGHCDGAEQGHCLRRSGGPVLPVAAPTVSETFHSAVGSGRPAGQCGGCFCWAADCFSCPSSISGHSRRAMPAPELSDGGHGGLSLHTGDHRRLGPLRGAPVPPGGRLRRGSAAAWSVEALHR